MANNHLLLAQSCRCSPYLRSFWPQRRLSLPRQFPKCCLKQPWLLTTLVGHNRFVIFPNISKSFLLIFILSSLTSSPKTRPTSACSERLVPTLSGEPPCKLKLIPSTTTAHGLLCRFPLTKGHHISLGIQNKSWHLWWINLLQNSFNHPWLQTKIWDRFSWYFFPCCAMGNHRNLNGHSRTIKLANPLTRRTDDLSQWYFWWRCLHAPASRFCQTKRRPPYLQIPQISLWPMSTPPSIVYLSPQCPSRLEPSQKFTLIIIFILLTLVPI